MTSRRAPPTPGSTTTTWIEPCGNSVVAVATTQAPWATSPGGMSWARSTTTGARWLPAIRAITPFIAPTYPSAVPKSVVNVMIAIAASGKHISDEQGLPGCAGGAARCGRRRGDPRRWLRPVGQSRELHTRAGAQAGQGPDDRVEQLRHDRQGPRPSARAGPSQAHDRVVRRREQDLRAAVPVRAARGRALPAGHPRRAPARGGRRDRGVLHADRVRHP